MSLVFPDQAPSRFSVALRSGTLKRLQTRFDDVKRSGLGANDDEAAARAVELVGLLSHHDRLTRGHTERVRAYADLIAEELDLPPGDRARLAWGSLLHDVGKLTVPPQILNKNGRPDDAEWAILREHPIATGKLLAPLEGWLGEWAKAGPEHHERWDGTGYPVGLAGTEISLAGRITAVADAYDVITSKRSYKTPMSSAAAKRELVDCAGTQFDPDVVRAFLNVSLGRKWFTGPLAWIAEIPQLANLGPGLSSAPAAVAGVVVAVGTAVAGSAVAPTIYEPEPILAFAPSTETSEIITLTTSANLASTSPQPEPTSEDRADTTTSSTSEPSDTQTSPATDERPTVPGDSSTAPPPTTVSTIQPTTTTAKPTTTRRPSRRQPTHPADHDDDPADNDDDPADHNDYGKRLLGSERHGNRRQQQQHQCLGSVERRTARRLRLPDTGRDHTTGQRNRHDRLAPGNPANVRIGYRSNSGFTGVDQFTYQICDTTGSCATATATLTVTLTRC